MKIAVAFLLVALSGLFDSGNAFLSAGGKKGSSKGHIFPVDCLKKLMEVSVPQSLEKLQELLCMYMQGRKTENEKLYKKFLCEVHDALKTAGCTVDQILSLPKFLEKVGDEVGEVAKQLGLELFNLVEELGVAEPVYKLACELLGETLKTLSSSLGVLNLNVGGGVLKGDRC